MRISFILFLLLCPTVAAFVQRRRYERTFLSARLGDIAIDDESEESSVATTPPASSRETEKTLRMEIVERNSIIDDEGKYAVLDGRGMDTEARVGLMKDDASEGSSAIESSDDAKKLERLIKTRPYPLFLMEKGVEIVEDIVDSLFTNNNNNNNKEQTTPSSQLQEREKIVVLGTYFI